MILTITDVMHAQLLGRFPISKPELYYDKIWNNKVQNGDIYMLIPKGMKVYVWFTYWQDKNICLVLSSLPSYKNNRNSFNNVNSNNNNENKINICVYPYFFSNKCALGTIMYGTLFDYKGMKHFACEDLCYYKGQKVNDQYIRLLPGTISLLELKLDLLKDLFIRQNQQHSHYKKGSLVIGLPVMCVDLEEAFCIADKLPYSVYSIQSHYFLGKPYHKHATYLIKNGMPVILASVPASVPVPAPIYVPVPAPIYVPINKIPAMFVPGPIFKYKNIYKIKATIKDDIYNVLSDEDGISEKLIGIALIPTYKSSVMMNSLFRNIRENKNLDLLEESEDEEDFENVNENKYVNLDKSWLMNCVYSKKFKKWQPISIVHDNKL